MLEEIVANVPAQMGGQRDLAAMGDEAVRFDGVLPCWATNVAQVDGVGVALMMRLTGPADYRVEDFLGKTFPVTYWMVRTAQFVNEESGEVTNGLRCTLCGPNGESLNASSMGVYDSIRRLVSFIGPGPWNPPIPIRLRETRTRQGRRMVTFDVVDLSVPPTDGSGKIPF